MKQVEGFLWGITVNGFLAALSFALTKSSDKMYKSAGAFLTLIIVFLNFGGWVVIQDPFSLPDEKGFAWGTITSGLLLLISFIFSIKRRT